MKQQSALDSILSLFALNRLSYPKNIRSKVLDLLYSNLYLSLFAILFIATFLVVVFSPFSDHLPIGIWYSAVVTIVIIRFADTYMYKKNPNRYTRKKWYFRFCSGVIASALIWGLAPMLFILKDEPAYTMFLTIVIVGLSAGAVTSLAPDRRLSHIYLYTLLLPLLIQLSLLDGIIYNSMFILTALFLFFVSSAIRQIHTTILNEIKAQLLYTDTREQLQLSDRQHIMMFEQTPIGSFYYDNDFNITDCNTALCYIMHTEKKMLVGLNLYELPDQRPIKAMTENLKNGKMAVYNGPYNTKISGLELWVKIQMIPLIDTDGEKIGGLCLLEDKTLEHAALLEAEFLSLHDPLTMLPNRKLLKDRMIQLIAEEQRERSYSAVLFLDLDRFKDINDAYGHSIGDKLLIETSRRITSLLRESDTLSRLGGDEFVVLLPMLAHEHDPAIYHAHKVAQKIHDALRPPYLIDHKTMYISCSIGIIIIKGKSLNASEILRRADIAMYQAKSEGRNRTHFYDASMDEKTRKNIHMMNSLRNAINNNELSLYFQPIIHIKTNEVHAAEALLRWQYDDKGFIPLSDLIPVAEESGLIGDIGKWVISTACRQMRIWQENSSCNLKYITINISPKQLRDPHFSSFLLQSIKSYHLQPSSIKLEVTESALIENFDETKLLIEKLNHEGIEFIIDDFGTGYSSLSYLKTLPFSTLKIDRSFIRDILTDPDDATLIRAIMDIAHQFGYQIVAEGVEEEAQRRKLMEINDTILYQGFLMCKPCTISEFEEFISEWQTKEQK